MRGTFLDILLYRVDYKHHSTVSHTSMKKITEIIQDVRKPQNRLETVTKLTISMSNIKPMNKVGKKRTYVAVENSMLTV